MCLVVQLCPTLQPHGLQSARLLCPWGFSSQGYWSGLPCPPPGDLPNPRIEHRSPAFRADSLLSESQGNPLNVSAQFSCSIVSDSLQPRGLQQARFPCPSTTQGIYSNSCPLSQLCHLILSSSVAPFSSWLQSLQASGSFPMS